MSTYEPQPHNRPVWMFMAATAMATIISTATATAMVEANARAQAPLEVTCECDAPPTPAAPTPPASLAADAPPASVGSTALVPASVEVDGPLDKAVIRHIVRAHLDDVRWCYNEGLADDPDLAGRVTVQFAIGPQGSVEQTAVVFTSLGHTEVPACIERVVGHWTFPAPDNAKRVTVTYPFVLEPG